MLLPQPLTPLPFLTSEYEDYRGVLPCCLSNGSDWFFPPFTSEHQTELTGCGSFWSYAHVLSSHISRSRLDTCYVIFNAKAFLSSCCLVPYVLPTAGYLHFGPPLTSFWIREDQLKHSDSFCLLAFMLFASPWWWLIVEYWASTACPTSVISSTLLTF